MSAGPLRRATAIVGLLALAPIAGMILNGTLTAEQAALRAVLVVGAVLLVGNLARIVLEQLLHRVEKDLITGVVEEPGSNPGTRAADRQTQAGLNRRSVDRGGGAAAAG
jgi:hypothetical protein